MERSAWRGGCNYNQILKIYRTPSFPVSLQSRLPTFITTGVYPASRTRPLVRPHEYRKSRTCRERDARARWESVRSHESGRRRRPAADFLVHAPTVLVMRPNPQGSPSMISKYLPTCYCFKACRFSTRADSSRSFGRRNCAPVCQPRVLR